MRRLAFLPLITMLVLAACAAPGVDQSPPGLTAVASSFVPADATPTATIVWFPPTSTWTPFPTPIASPTLEALPGLGVDTFSDDFSKAQDWQGAKTESDGSNSVIVNR